MNILQEYKVMQKMLSGDRQTKIDLLGRKFFLIICWDGVHFEMLPVDIRITTSIYCHQFKYLNTALKEQRPSFINCQFWKLDDNVHNPIQQNTHDRD